MRNSLGEREKKINGGRQEGKESKEKKRKKKDGRERLFGWFFLRSEHITIKRSL